MGNDQTRSYNSSRETIVNESIKIQDFPVNFPVSREIPVGEGFSRDCEHHQIPHPLVEKQLGDRYDFFCFAAL